MRYTVILQLFQRWRLKWKIDADYQFFLQNLSYYLIDVLYLVVFLIFRTKIISDAAFSLAKPHVYIGLLFPLFLNMMLL